MVHIHINFQKKDLFLVIAIGIFVIGVGFVIAYTYPGQTANPAVMGHTADEIEGLGGAGGGSCSFGDWQNVTSSASGGAVQGPATSDGFVTAYSIGDVGSDNTYGITDSNNPPTTIRIQDEWYELHSDTNRHHAFVMFPVRKGDYWKVQNTYGAIVWWAPLNCGGGSTTYDSGWFAVSANSQYNKLHNLGTLPKSATIWFSPNADGSNSRLMGTELLERYDPDGTYGLSLFGVNSTGYGIETGNWIVAMGKGAYTSNGYARVILST